VRAASTSASSGSPTPSRESTCTRPGAGGTGCSPVPTQPGRVLAETTTAPHHREALFVFAPAGATAVTCHGSDGSVVHRRIQDGGAVCVVEGAVERFTITDRDGTHTQHGVTAGIPEP